jgi:mevalonate kinase
MCLSYRANGKLLLTGEYFVLDGAEALSVPLKVGQVLTLTKTEAHTDCLVSWHAAEHGNTWFTAEYNRYFEMLTTSDERTGLFLQRLFKTIVSIRPGSFDNQFRYTFQTNLEFSRNWGLGSSSTLVALLSAWTDIDPFELYFRNFSGSGYDVAAANQTGPFVYSVKGNKVDILSVRLHREVTSSLYFAWLGRKQDSQQEVENFRSNKTVPSSIIKKISSLTKEMVSASSLTRFEEIVVEHEKIVAEYLGRTRIQQERFPGFSGTVKSLGAWGGDFVMITYPGKKAELENYLNKRGIRTFFGFDELVLGEA